MTTLPQASIWLLPSNPSLLSPTISELSDEYGVPLFKPHVTLHCTFEPTSVEHLVEALRLAAVKQLQSETLKVESVGHSPIRFKTLFLEFEHTHTLFKLAKNLASALPSDYEFVPHLSLMYHHDLPEEKRIALQTKYIAKFSGMELNFSEVALVSPGTGKSDFEDVEAWEILKVFQLGEKHCAINCNILRKFII